MYFFSILKFLNPFTLIAKLVVLTKELKQMTTVRTFIFHLVYSLELLPKPVSHCVSRC